MATRLTAKYDPTGLAGAMKNSVQDKPVQAHVFEYTCTMGLTPDMKFKFASTDKGMVPTQILFCLKEKNAK
jgi:chitin synthase